MRTSRSLLFFTTYLLYLTTFTSAWPWPVDKFLPPVDSLVVRDAFHRRAETETTTSASETASASSAAKTTASEASASASASDNSKTNSVASETASGSGSASGTAEASGSGSASGSSGTGKVTGKTTATTTKKTSTTSSVSIAANAAAGGLEMLIPDTTSGSMFYKISDYVTFAWNYTSLSVTPTAINVYATCTSNSQMYTITHNMSVSANATGEVVWDTNDYPEQTTAPLLTAIYTMYIFDADSSISAEASAGHLSVFDYAFGMYTKQAYTPLASGWTCATCSGALSPDERRYMGFVAAMAGITVLSFTWFVTGLGVVW